MGIGLKDIMKDDKNALVEDKEKKRIKILVTCASILLVSMVIVGLLIVVNFINHQREERVQLVAKDVMNISNVVKSIGRQYITNTYDGLLVGTSLENDPQEINVNGKIVQYRYGYYYLTPEEMATLITSLNYKDEAYFVNYITGDVVNLRGVRAKGGKTYYSLEDITAIDAGLVPKNIIYIHNAQEMQYLHQYPNAIFYLSENIDMGSYAESGEGWKPVDNFSGTLDGRGYTITNLPIARPTTMYCGLFGQASSTAIIKNVIFENVNIRGGEYTGVVAGFCSGNIENIDVIGGEVNSQAESIGGLVGAFDHGTVKDCNVLGLSVSANGSVGGLIGTLYSGTIHRNGVDKRIIIEDREEIPIEMNIVGIRSVGGLVGEVKANADTVMTENYADARITGTSEVGGFIGDVQLISQSKFKLNDCYSQGAISSGNENIGGSIGNIYAVNNPEIEIQSVYTATDTPASANIRGGFFGKTNIAEGTSVQVLKCCFEKDPLLDLNVADIGNKAGSVSLVINSKTPTEMKNRLTYVDWNFDLWTLEEGINRPYLKWQDENYEAQIIEEEK